MIMYLYWRPAYLPYLACFTSPLLPATACIYNKKNFNFIFLKWKWTYILMFPGIMIFSNDNAWQIKASLAYTSKWKKTKTPNQGKQQQSKTNKQTPTPHQKKQTQKIPTQKVFLSVAPYKNWMFSYYFFVNYWYPLLHTTSSCLYSRKQLFLFCLRHYRITRWP